MHYLSQNKFRNTSCIQTTQNTMYHKNRVFTAACLGLLLFGMVAVSLGSVLPEIIKTFQVSELSVGLLTSLLPASILVGALCFGPIADRYGFKGLLLACCTLVLIGLESLAYGRSWGMIQLAVVLIGCGGGALNGATNALVADISEGERGAKLSLLGVFYGVGAILMPVLLAALSTWLSREAIFTGIGGLVVCVMVYIGVLTFPQPKQQQGLPLKQGLQLLKNKTLLLFSAILFIQMGMENIINNWVTSFLQSNKAILPQMALMALTAHMVSLTAMRLVLSRLLKRFQSAHILMACVLFIILGCLLLWLNGGYVSNIVALMLIGAGFAGTFPIIFAEIGTIWADISGTAFSIVLALALLGGTLFNYLMGLVAYQFGIATMPMLLLSCAVLLVVAVKGVLPIFAGDKVEVN